MLSALSTSVVSAVASSCSSACSDLSDGASLAASTHGTSTPITAPTAISPSVPEMVVNPFTTEENILNQLFSQIEFS